MPYPTDFIATVSVRISADWYDPDYVQNVRNIPKRCIEILKEEPDYEVAMAHRQGVMFDLHKQLFGCKFPDTTKFSFDEKTKEMVSVTRKGKLYKPKPQYYQFFAYTAYALLHGDISSINWREPYKGNIQGQDVVYAMNKYGVYGLTDPLVGKFDKKLMLSKFAALYARMFNVDPRFQLKAAEPLELKTVDRESPLTYCGDCGTIRVAWDLHKNAYTPGDPEYDNLLARFKRQIMKSKLEKSAQEDQQRYLERAGTILDFCDYEDAESPT